MEYIFIGLFVLILIIFIFLYKPDRYNLPDFKRIDGETNLKEYEIRIDKLYQRIARKYIVQNYPNIEKDELCFIAHKDYLLILNKHPNLSEELKNNLKNHTLKKIHDDQYEDINIIL